MATLHDGSAIAYSVILAIWLVILTGCIGYIYAYRNLQVVKHRDLKLTVAALAANAIIFRFARKKIRTSADSLASTCSSIL